MFYYNQDQCVVFNPGEYQANEISSYLQFWDFEKWIFK